MDKWKQNADENKLMLVLQWRLINFFKKVFEKLRKTMFLFDSVGIGLFTILGIEKTLEYGLSPVIAVIWLASNTAAATAGMRFRSHCLAAILLRSCVGPNVRS